MIPVVISRPDALNVRRILVDGSVVGRIAPVVVDGRRIDWLVCPVDADRGEPYMQNRTLGRAVEWARSYERWPRTRWVYMSGEHGCLPDNAGCAEARDGAALALVELFELGGRRERSLRRSGYLELRRADGAEYCEISECICEECATGGDGGCCNDD